MGVILSACLGLLATGFVGHFGTDIEAPVMEVGTKFRDIGWGGAKNQPFKSGFNEVESADDPWNPRFLEELEIFLEEIGSENRGRLVLVMGGAMVHAFFRDFHLFVIESRKANPHGIRPDAYDPAP